MDLELVHNAAQQTLLVVRYIRTTAEDFGLGIEISEFIPATDNQPYYVFDEIVDAAGKPINWYWKSTSNCVADPETINTHDIFNSPISAQFELVSKKAFFEELENEIKEPDNFDELTEIEKARISSLKVLKSQLLNGLTTLGIGLIN